MQSGKRPGKFQRFLNLCRENHLRITPQRVAIFKAILNTDTHPNGDAVWRTIRQKYPNISFDTVNRTLLSFAEIGLAEVVEIFGGAKRFDPNVANHHYLHCVRCGKIIDFQNPFYDDLKVPEDLRDDFQVIFAGRPGYYKYRNIRVHGH